MVNKRFHQVEAEQMSHLFVGLLRFPRRYSAGPFMMRKCIRLEINSVLDRITSALVGFIFCKDGCIFDQHRSQFVKLLRRQPVLQLSQIWQHFRLLELFFAGKEGTTTR